MAIASIDTSPNDQSVIKDCTFLNISNTQDSDTTGAIDCQNSLIWIYNSTFESFDFPLSCKQDSYCTVADITLRNTSYNKGKWLYSVSSDVEVENVKTF